MRACSTRYLPQPMWLYTTEDDPGHGAAREAIEAGADVVVAIGGDGTVRAIAAELAGTEVPLAIIPMGTGNLFARNLDLPLGNTPALLRIALEGERRADRRGLARPGPRTAQARTSDTCSWSSRERVSTRRWSRAPTSASSGGSAGSPTSSPRSSTWVRGA